ncbi:MAG: FHA domain-containing protein [Planctomycetota bacterium]|jgi:hypothetical protein
MAGPTDPTLIVSGIQGFLKGEMRELEVGDAIVVGRSRSADLSLRRAKKFAERKDAAKILKSEAFLSVSRQHTRIHFLHPGLVEVKDLSSNGTYVDGKRATCVAITDFEQKTHIVALGTRERLRLKMRTPGEASTEVAD